jgi:hypothetical protein
MPASGCRKRVKLTEKSCALESLNVLLPGTCRWLYQPGVIPDVVTIRKSVKQPPVGDVRLETGDIRQVLPSGPGNTGNRF